MIQHSWWILAALAAGVGPSGSASGFDREEVRSELLEPGLVEAEAFRQELVKPDEVGHRPIEALATAILAFRDAADVHVRDAGRPDLAGFRPLTVESVAAAALGTGPAIDPAAAFGPFQGQWFGDWDGMKVDHDWSTVERFEPPHRWEAEGLPPMVAKQFAWIGDGFGWNVVSRLDSGGEVILGTVYHVAEGDPERVRYHQEHIGVAAGAGRLIWITRSEVFLEERLDDHAERYVITGFGYERDDDGRVRVGGRSFQAVYTRSPEDRPSFYKFILEDMDRRFGPG